MNIEISNPPLSADQLADKRRIHSEQLKAYVMRGRYYKYGFYTIGMVGVVIAGLLWMYGFIRDGELVGVCAVMAALVVIVMSMGRDIIVDSSVIVLIIVAQILLYALMVLAGLTGMLSIEVEIDTLGTSLGTTALVIVVAIAWNKWIGNPYKETEIALEDLVELEYSESPNECITFDQWRTSDGMIRLYANRVAELGRKPTIGEYKAAKNWMSSADERQKEAEHIVLAKQACDRMASTV